MNILKGLTGNEAAAEAARLAKPEVITAYPITPQTSLIEALAKMAAKGTLKDCGYVLAGSEFDAMAMLIGASQAGARCFTATSSQGLLFMDEALHWASGARLPIVLVNVNRSLGSPWCIHSDQTDSLSRRDSGWIQLYCKDNQACFDLTLMAFKMAENSYLPAMVNIDGFILSNNKKPVILPDQDVVDDFLPKIKYVHALDCKDPRSYGASGSAQYYNSLKREMAKSLRISEEYIRNAFEEFREKFGREYDFVEKYRMEDAEIAIVSTGSITTTLEDSVDDLRERGIKAGLVRICVFRPFPVVQLNQALRNIKKAVVFDANTREILLNELKASIYPKEIVLYGYTVAVGGVQATSEILAEKIREAYYLSSPRYDYSIWVPEEKDPEEKDKDTPDTEESKKEENQCGSAKLMRSGHRACGGCTATVVMRHMLDVFGEDTQIAMPACCGSIIAGPNPYTPFKVPLVHVPFAGGVSAACGIKHAARQSGKKVYAVAFGGDGGIYDIGFANLSSAAERGENIIVVVYNNGAYMNTGGQRSSATPYGAVTETTPWPNFKSQKKKDIVKIMAAHSGVVYAATCSVHNLEDFKMKLLKCKDHEGRGLRFLDVLAPCNTGWKFSPENAIKMAYLAVETKDFPLYEYENGKWKITYRPEREVDILDYLKIQGRFAELAKDEEKVNQVRKNIKSFWEDLEKLEKYF